MGKERVLIFDDQSERSSILSSNLISLGYDVIILEHQHENDIQRKIQQYQPDYIVTETDELVALHQKP